MCDKDFCTLYSLFMLALARKELSTCSFRLFIGEKPNLLQTIEDLPTKATDEELKEAFVDEWGVKYSKDGRKLLKAPQELDGTSLTSLVIPDGVTSIGKSAFSGCEYLSSLVIPDSVTSIGDMAFCGCSSLTRLVIPGSVSCIGFSAFENCKSLRSIVIPESVVNLNGNPFCRWDGELKCLSPYFIYDNKVLFNKDKSKIIAFRDKNTTSYVIPDSVSCIGIGAFAYCKSLTSIVIPDSVTRIGGIAFLFCESLSNIVIPDSVTCIGKRAFAFCYFPNDIKQELISRFGE